MLSFFQQTIHLLLYLAAIFCALILRGDPRMVYTAMGAAVLTTALSRLPRNWFPPFLRQLVQVAIAAAVLAWAYRQMTHTPVDLLLVEIATLLGVSLFLGNNAHEYRLIFFISIGFLGYGGLMPGRPFFLPVFTAALLLILTILYTSRLAILQPTKNSRLLTARPAVTLRHTFSYRLLHAVGTVAIILLMLRHLPQTQALKTKGLIPVSFTTETEIEFPQLWKRWHQPDTQQTGGESETNAEQTPTDETASPSTRQLDPKGAKISSVKDAPSFDSRSGNGFGFTMGNGLVFQAVSPAKLYWVVQMYDDYDGNAWHVSPAMVRGNTGPDRFIPVHEVEVPQHISLENPSSPKLPYAFRFRQVSFQQKIDRKGNNMLFRDKTTDPFTITVRAKQFPKPPWRYRVQSFVPNPEMKKPLRAWREPLRNNGWNYRRLPADIISDRLRDLADTITKDATSPFDKAVRIRDYLRTNCTYTLQPPPIPPDRETVDYFLFESKRGYCQHFAQAFTVLARLAGLHSRLVTGYAPGNYNLLTNTFEVYQYHAHAWTHIFAEPYGWLTFDGVAPANLNLQNTPAIFTDLMDPFGEEWNARPPELTYIPPPSPEQSMTQPAPTENAESFAGQVYEKAARDNHTDSPDSTELGKAAVQIAATRLSGVAARLWHAVTSTVLALWNGARNATLLLVFTIRKMRPVDGLAAVFCAATIIAAWCRRRWLTARLRFLYRLYRCRRDWFHLEHTSLTPRQRILICHSISRRYLALAGFVRPPDRDILETADLLANSFPEAAPHYRTVAANVSLLQFSPFTPSTEQADDTVAATAAFCRLLSTALSQQFAETKH